MEVNSIFVFLAKASSGHSRNCISASFFFIFFFLAAEFIYDTFR